MYHNNFWPFQIVTEWLQSNVIYIVKIDDLNAEFFDFLLVKLDAHFIPLS